MSQEAENGSLKILFSEFSTPLIAIVCRVYATGKLIR